jgi:hypothetical protein
MSRKVAPFIDIVRLEDKETKLKTFIRTLVEQTGGSNDADPKGGAVLLIARSVESPVAKAVAALVREGTIRVPVKTILALAPRQEAEGVSETLAAIVGTHGGRVVRDVRLFDAHEQIVLGQAASWVGDCMRRDPMKRDAYECFAGDCSKTAGWARTSFERLWDICEALPEELLQPAASPLCPPPVGVEDAAADPVGSAQG